MAARNPYLHLAIYALVMAAVVVGIHQGAVSTGYDWDWHRVPQYLFTWEDGRLVRGVLIDGLIVTLKISAAAFVLMIVFGLVAALLARSSSLVGRGLARVYVEVVRNTPLLVQLYIVYFALSPVLGLDRLTAAILTLALFEGAYAAEMFRAGLDGVPRGQWEAAHALGLGRAALYGRVVLPQAVRLVLPPLTGQTVSLIKDSSIVSVIAVFELTTEARNIVSDTFLVFEIWFTVAAIYLPLTVTHS